MSERDIRKLTQKVVEQNKSIPFFRESDSIPRTANMIVEEAQELVSELEKAFVTDDMTQVLGELGDVLYLALKMADSLGVNADELVEMKRLRNIDKYSGYSDGVLAKKEWEEKGGDKMWYQLYLTTIAEIED